MSESRFDGQLVVCRVVKGHLKAVATKPGDMVTEYRHLEPVNGCSNIVPTGVVVCIDQVETNTPADHPSNNSNSYLG